MTFEELRKALRTLCLHGLRDEALGLARQCGVRDLAPEQRDALAATVRQTRALQCEVFFPLVDRGDAGRDRRVQVKVERCPGDVDQTPGEGVLAPAAARAVLEAVDAAWAQLGGVDARPRVRVSLPLLEDVPTERREVDGSSLFLATFLAAVGCFGERRPIRNVLATGAPGVPLDHLGRKRRQRDDGLGVTDLLALGVSADSHPPEGLQVVRCEDLRHAIALTYRLTPVLRFASARCLHAYCGERRDLPARFLNRTMLKPEPLALAPTLTPENFRANLDAVLAAIPAREPVELSLGTTVCFAAALGWRLANGARQVWMIDAGEDVPWWSTGDRPTPAPAAPNPPRAHARRIVTRYPERAPGDWEPVVIPSDVHREDVPGLVGRIAHALSGVVHLDLAFDAPLALAFAVGTSLRNAHAAVEFWHFDGRGYERVYAARRDGT